MNEEEIFHTAAELPAAARSAYLHAACEGEPAVRARVERLLVSHDDLAFMQRPADRTGSAEVRAELAPLKPEEGEDWIGNYKLLQKIGEGGFGTVWMAEQLEPVRRRVALKIIKLGMDTKEVIVRFEQERQALALMDHPNIAKVLDAGVTSMGRPFFVMELVRGIRITEFCDQGNLSTAQRLDLFIAVCKAIQHAHQKGVIHRDIKPSNILVTPHDGVPMPKVIDFGVAKAIQSERLTELTFFTRFDQMIGTPLYMSPEQAGMSGLDIDTRSDIYSLGVLLYELLTCTTPFDAKELMASGIEAMRKTIRETEPLRPSTRLTQALVAAKIIPHAPSPEFAIPSEAEVSADLRRRRLKEQINRLRGDLDWIVMKCLEKDRSRRYETANGLAADLKRHLNNEPVIARPPSVAYKLQKAWRRNKLVFTAVGAVGTALAVGISVSTWQAFEASRARDAEKQQRLAAQTERDKARSAQTEAEHYLYIANMNLAGRAWEQGNFGQLLNLLEETRTFPGRGFEWYYWQRQAHLNLQTLRGHVGTLKSVAFSPDGQRIVTGSEDQTARVWDLTGGRGSFPLRGHSAAITCVAFSPDGQRIVTASADHTAKVWDVATQRELGTFIGHTDQISSVAFSQDGQRIVTASTDRSAKVWDVPTQRELVTLKRHTNQISSVAFSPDGQRILTGSADQTARLWDANSGRELHILPGHGWEVLSVAFSPDGERVLTGYKDRYARFWETATGRELGTILSGSGPVSSVAFSPDGKLVVTGSWDSTATVWDALNGTNLLRLLGHSRGVHSVAFSPDGKKVATAGDEAAKIWDASSDRESLALQGKAQGALAVAISADGRRIVTGGTFQVDGSNLEPGEQSAEVWDAASGKQLTTLTGHSSGISSAAFSPDGLWIVTGSRDQTARVWETATGKECFPLEGHKGSVNSVAFSPDGQRIVTGGQDHTAKVWEVASRRVILQLIRHTDSVTSVGFSWDGTRIVTGSLDNTARVWEAADGRELYRLQSPLITRILSVAFSPDGEWVVGGGYGSLVWKVATGDVICQLIGDNTSVSSVAFSPDGRRIATGSYGGNARLWEAITGRELLTLSAYGRVGMSVAFSRDGLRIITGSINLPARVWQAARLDEVAAWDAEELAAANARVAWQQELAAQLRKRDDEERRR